MVIEPHMKQGRQHKLISTIFLATSVTKKLDHNKRRIREALAVDERITGVTDFEFDLTVKGVVHAYFTVKTIYGDIKAEKGVKI